MAPRYARAVPPLADAPPMDPAALRRAALRGFLTAVGLAAACALGLGLVAATPQGAAAWASLRGRLGLGSLAAAFGLISLAFVAMGHRWRALLPPGDRPPALGLTALVLAGLLLNYAIPGPMGELGAAWLAHRRYGLRTADALAAGVGARLVGLAMAVSLACGAALAGAVPAGPDWQRSLILGAGALGLVTLLGFLIGFWPSLWAAPLHRAAARLPGRLGVRATAAVDAAAFTLSALVRRGPRAWISAAVWSLAGHLAVTAGIAVAVWGLGAAPALLPLLFVYATSTAGAVLLFALPGSQVGWDALFGGLLVGVAGLLPEDALVVVALVRAQQLSFMGIGAAVVAWMLRPKRSAPLPDPPSQT